MKYHSSNSNSNQSEASEKTDRKRKIDLCQKARKLKKWKSKSPAQTEKMKHSSSARQRKISTRKISRRRKTTRPRKTSGPRRTIRRKEPMLCENCGAVQALQSSESRGMATPKRATGRYLTQKSGPKSVPRKRGPANRKAVAPRKVRRQSSGKRKITKRRKSPHKRGGGRLKGKKLNLAHTKRVRA